MQHPDDRIWNLLALKLSREASPGDLIELDNYLKDHAEVKNIADRIDSFWNQAGEVFNVTDEMEDERFHLILDAEKEEETKDENDLKSVGKLLKPHKYKWLYAAASVIFILGFGFLLQRNSDFKSPAPKEIQQVFVKPGSKSKIILPDETVVILNSSSRLTYNKDFNEKVREVSLEGEAYFDVTKDANHPFIVHASNIDIKVLGTLFDVKSYYEDQTIETTLLRGSIEVYNKDDPSAPKVILKPNEKLVFNKNENKKITDPDKIDSNLTKKKIPHENISISTLPLNKPDSLREETSWLYNKLVIDGDNFTQMSKKMERWYGVQIEILSPELEQYHFNGVFENETIEQALDALKLTVKFRYVIKDNIVKIME